MSHHVIVGTGIAGLSAVEAIRAAEPSADITMVGSEPHAFYSRPGLAYFLADAIPRSQLAIRTRDELRALAVDRRVDEVERIEPTAHEVVLAGAGALRYDRLLLATGSAALPADFPGADLDGVVMLDDLDDALDLVERAGRARTAVVVGGGPTAVELAEGLGARGLRVHYLLRGARYWASVLDPVESLLVEEALEHEGVVVHRHTRVARAVGDAGRVVAVETSAGETIRCEILAVAIGVRPRTRLAREAALVIDRGVVTDDRLQTSAQDVFAAGDVAQVHDAETGASTLDVLWSSALAQGRAAGAVMAGGTEAYRRPPSLNVTRLGKLTTTVVGAVGHGGTDEDLLTIARGDSEAWRIDGAAWTLEDHHAAVRIRALVGERTVVGAVVIGDRAASRALCRLVRERVDISALRSELTREPATAIARLVAAGAEHPAHAEEPGRAPRA